MTTRRRLNTNSAAHVANAEERIRLARDGLNDARNMVRRDPDYAIRLLADAQTDLADALLDLYKARMNDPVDED